MTQICSLCIDIYRNIHKPTDDSTCFSDELGVFTKDINMYRKREQLTDIFRKRKGEPVGGSASVSELNSDSICIT